MSPHAIRQFYELIGYLQCTSKAIFPGDEYSISLFEISEQTVSFLHIIVSYQANNIKKVIVCNTLMSSKLVVWN